MDCCSCELSNTRKTVSSQQVFQHVPFNSHVFVLLSRDSCAGVVLINPFTENLTKSRSLLSPDLSDETQSAITQMKALNEYILMVLFVEVKVIFAVVK